MSEEIIKILDKFDRTLKEYELDKKVGQPSIDDIYFLYPSEMITIKNYIMQNENIINELDKVIIEFKKQIEEERKNYREIIGNFVDKIQELKGSDKE